MNKLKFVIFTMLILAATSITVCAMEPSYDSPHVATCGASSYILKEDHSLWFFGEDTEEYLTPVKVMDNVKKVTLTDMSTTYGAYMPTSLILTYDGDLYIGGVCRYCPFNISDEISLVHPEKIWDDVRDMDAPNGSSNYAFIDNNGDLHTFFMGEANDVLHADFATMEDYYSVVYPDRQKYNLEWITNFWWDIDDLAEEDTAAGFYIFVKKDGSVWTAIDSSADSKWYHGFVLGNGTEAFASYNKSIYNEPVQIMPAGSCYTNISVYLDDELLEFDTKPIIKDERTLVPIRAIFEQMGYTVEWNQSEQTAYAVYGTDSIRVKLNDPQIAYTLNGVSGNYECDVVPQLIDDRILVPLRAIAECAGCEVKWDGDTYTVNINSIKNLMMTQLADIVQGKQ